MPASPLLHLASFRHVSPELFAATMARTYFGTLDYAVNLVGVTGSGRLGTGQAPPAVRKASHNSESYSPRLDADLFDAARR